MLPYLPRLCNIRFACHWLFRMAVFIPAGAIAQTSYHISTGDGLSTNNMTAVIRGKDNYMWTGSYNGLHKHEGAMIRVYNTVGADDHSISSGEMHTVFEDNKGYIWIGTTGGLDRLDPRTNLIKHFVLRAGNNKSSNLGYIYSVFQDKQEYIWVSTDVALFRMHPGTGAYHEIPVTKNGSGVLSPVISYKGGVSTTKGVWMYTNAGMVFYDYTSRQYHHRYNNPYQLAIFAMGRRQGASAASELCVDRKSRLYFIANNQQLIQYDITSGRIDSFAFQHPAEAWKCCYSLTADRFDNIWIGFRHGGLLFFDAKNQTFTPVVHNGINSLVRSNYVYSLTEDYTGRLWVTTNNGVDVIDWYGSAVKQTHLSNDSHFLHLDRPSGMMSYDGGRYLYIPFFRGGVFRYDIQTDSVQHYLVKDTAEQHVSYADIDQQGIVRLGNRKTLTRATFSGTGIRYDRRQDMLTKRLQETRTSVTATIRDTAGGMYIKKVNGLIYYFNGDSLEKIPGYGFMRQMAMSKDSQYLLYIDPELNIVKRHLYTRKGDTISVMNKLAATGFHYFNPRDIADDGNGNIWLSTQNGVVRYNAKTDSIYVYTARQGLSNNFTYAICADSKKRIWVASLGGIDWFDVQHGVFKQVVSSPSATYMDSYGSAMETGDGSIFFLGGNKLFRIHPDRYLAQAAHTYQLVLNEVQVNGVTIDPADKSTLLHLRHYQNRLAFRFGLLDFIPQRDVRYYYWLEGAEHDWIENNGRSTVSYNALPPGKFILHLKATDASGNLLGAAQQLVFRVRAPFWKTTWFRILAIAALAGIAWMLYNYRQRKQREKAQQKLAMAESRFLNLRLQMNPHFLFNSLNSIQHLVVTQQDAKAYQYLTLFSHLLRSVLQNSQRDFISLDTELDMLKLYLDLEALRFKDTFHYEIIVDENLDEEEVMVPSLLVQPFAENAIWHGLLNKTGSKRLTITFTNTDDCLTCYVQDNGIGREKAAALKSEQVDILGHESKGMDIVKERLGLLEQRTGKKSGIMITDLYDGAEPAGTLVEIKIPFYYSEET